MKDDTKESSPNLKKTDPSEDLLPNFFLVGRGWFTSKPKKDAKIVIEIPLNPKDKDLSERVPSVDLV